MFTRCQLHLGDKNFAQKDADALVASFNFGVVATGQPAAVQLDAVAGKHEHQNDEKDRDEQDFFEAATKLVDDFSHVRNQNENAERSQTTQQEQQLGTGILRYNVGHPAERS